MAIAASLDPCWPLRLGLAGATPAHEPPLQVRRTWKHAYIYIARAAWRFGIMAPRDSARASGARGVAQAALVGVAAALLAATGSALNNGVGRTPALGYNSA